MSAPTRRVAIMVSRDNALDRGILSGIARFRGERSDWQFHNYPQRLDSPPTSLRGFADGLITHIRHAGALKALEGMNLPTVHCIAGESPGWSVGCVCPDDRAIGRMAAEHLLERGLGHFAYEGYLRSHISHLRYEGFVAALRDAGHEGPVPRFFSPADPTEAYEHTARWLEALPKPVGIFAFHDQRAERLLEVIRWQHLRVPRDVALLGVNNDQAVCEFTHVHLSSIDPDAERIGYEAAALLERMMDGHPPPDAPQRVPPIMVHARASTHVMMVNDPEVVRALRFIENHAREGIGVEDVLDELMISRSSLWRRFRKATGHSVHDEIREVRMREVLRLLRETNHGLADIAARSGFKRVSHLCDAVKAATGRTPGEFRGDVAQRG